MDSSRREVHDFSIVDGRPIQLDIWLNGKSSSPIAKPAIVFFHGGKLVAGNRRSLIPEFLHNLARSRHWAFISADYRLLIPASGKEMLEDVLSLFKYIGNSIPQVDPSRIAVFGSSAGAYPARLAGIYAKPKPKVIAMIYGRGGDFFSAPYLADPPGCSSDMLREVSHMIHPNPDESAGLKYEWDVMETDPEISTLLSTSNPVRTSRILWTAIMAEGKALDYITGITGLGGKLRASRATSIRPPGSGTTANATFPTRQVSSTTLAGGEAALVNLDLIPSESKRLLPQLCMDANFPPTYLIHGLLDTSVLPEESIRTYDQLRELGVPVELSLVEGEGHCFEWKREEESGIKDILDKAADFLANYLG